MARVILRTAVKASGVPKHVTCMTLRHSYAVHRLKEGATIREVQEALGHENVYTTLIYEQYLVPETAESPADTLDIDRANIGRSRHRKGQTLQVFHDPLTTHGTELLASDNYTSRLTTIRLPH